MASHVRSIGRLAAPGRLEALTWAETELAPAVQTAHEGIRIRVSPTLIVGAGDAGTGAALTPALDDALSALALPLRIRAGDRVAYAASPATAIEHLSALATEGGPDVIVQPVEAPLRNGRRYPTLTGELLTENAYPISYLAPADGVARVVFGLGDDLAERADALRFSPRHPDLMPDFSQPEDILRNAQTRFLALVEEAGELRVEPHRLDVGRADGTLGAVGGIVSIENQTVYPGVHRKGVPVVTCAMLLRGHPVRLAPLLADLVERLRARGDTSGSPDDTSGSPGNTSGSSGARSTGYRLRFALDLPAAGESGEALFRIEDLEPLPRLAPPPPPADARVLLATRSVLGHGGYPDVRDIVYVPPDRFDVHRSSEIAKDIAAADRWIAERGDRYVLVVAGRIGSSDRSLGVPLRWADIAHAAVQVEVALTDFNVEESRGSHFFRQLTRQGVAYLHVSLAQPGEVIHWDRLAALEARHEGTFIRHVRLEDPALAIWVDGTSATAWMALGTP